MAEALAALTNKKKYNKFDFYFPEKGENRRELYPKHLAFMEAGAFHSRRAFIAANRVGKSVAGAYELVCHLTGNYPDWWTGKRFKKPVKAWACALENKQLREGIQEILFGDFADKGTGMIPRAALQDDKGNLQVWAMPGSANCVLTARVRHISGEWSQVDFKTYEQGWQQFQGTKRDVIWLDEEPNDNKIYQECITRTAGKKGEEGILYCTFTPLLGYSSVVLGFLPNGQMPPNGVHPENPEKFVISATWEECPHLSEEWKKAQLLEYDATQRDARSKGIPAMGSGRIFPVDEDFIKVKPFEIPEYWPRAYGLDFGWNATAVVWIAQDPVTKCKYLYAEYKRGKVAPYVHVQNIKAKGDWIGGAADPAGGGSNIKDGSRLIDEYLSLGLRLTPGDNSINSGLARLLNELESGQFKVFSTCEGWLNEFRTYRYDLNNPNIPARNQEDHEMDATRYVDSIFDYIASSEYDTDKEAREEIAYFSRMNNSRDSTTGY